jgi:hypothetical protein
MTATRGMRSPDLISNGEDALARHVMKELDSVPNLFLGETDRQTNKGRDRDRDREKQGERHREKERERDREIERDRDRDRGQTTKTLARQSTPSMACSKK